MIARCRDKKYRRTIFLVVVVVGVIAFFDILYSYNQDIFGIQKRVIPSLPLCRNVLQVMRQGSWIQKPYITPEDIKRRYEMNIILRKHRGQPTYLNRSDFRCGINYLIPAPDFGPKIPALCMRNSDRHCCNADGLCSNGHGNCSCVECTDFRNIVEAELYDWLPPGCKIMNYSSDESCTMVGERLTNLVIVGDSLMRHFFVALMLLFTGDSNTGALRKHLAHCMGERQFVDRGKANCHTFIATSSAKQKGKFCQGKAKFSLVFKEYYNLGLANKILGVVEKHLDRSNSLIVLGIGMHNGFNVDEHQSKLIDPILKLIGSRKWPRLLWTTTHAQGFLKPPSYRKMGQNNEKISQYNRVMRDQLKMKGVEVFDVFPMTKGVHSYDGTHYGYGMNMIKAQYLINYIHQTIQAK